MYLLSPCRLGKMTLANRVVMAPMTRSRAVDDGLPHPAAATYYAQRAGAGLIVSEGTQISHQARGYIRTPGIHTDEQVVRWRAVTDAVHRAGGRIFCQLWHCGRVSDPWFQNGEKPVAPSAIAAQGMAFTPAGPQPLGLPRALELEEITVLIGQYVEAARRADEAGFDGVEVHGANGYLLDQFLRDGSNQRNDSYGGSAANRARLPLEITAAVAAELGSDRVGYRVSPAFSAYSMHDSNSRETFGCLARGLSGRIAYLHVVEPVAGDAAPASDWQRLTPMLRQAFRGLLIVNGGYDRERAEQAVGRGEADLVSFGLPFIANPDLPLRFAQNAALSRPNPDNIYQGEEDGYIDYPALADAVAR